MAQDLDVDWRASRGASDISAKISELLVQMDSGRAEVRYSNNAQLYFEVDQVTRMYRRLATTITRKTATHQELVFWSRMYRVAIALMRQMAARKPIQHGFLQYQEVGPRALQDARITSHRKIIRRR